MNNKYLCDPWHTIYSLINDTGRRVQKRGVNLKAQLLKKFVFILHKKKLWIFSRTEYNLLTLSESVHMV